MPIPHALISERFRADSRERTRALITNLADRGCQVVVAPNPVVDQLTQGRGLGDILAIIPLPPQADLPSVARDQGVPVFLVAVDVVDAGNVGALARTAHGLRAAAFLAVGRTDAFHPRAVRTAMGSLFKLPIARFADLDTLAGALQPLNVALVGAVSLGGVSLPEAIFNPEGVAIVVGGEYHGLSAAEMALLDARVTIPMPEGIDSLSVNAAAAILLYEATRRLGPA